MRTPGSKDSAPTAKRKTQTDQKMEKTKPLPTRPTRHKRNKAKREAKFAEAAKKATLTGQKEWPLLLPGAAAGSAAAGLAFSAANTTTSTNLPIAAASISFTTAISHTTDSFSLTATMSVSAPISPTYSHHSHDDTLEFKQIIPSHELNVSTVKYRHGKKPKGLFTWRRFRLWLERTAKGWEFEKSAAYTDGDIYMKNPSKFNQTSAQQGRASAAMVEFIARVAGVDHSSRVADIGAGVLNVALQLIAVCGCEATAVELMPNRYNVGLEFLEQFEEDFPQLKSHLVQNICGDFVSHIDMLSTLTHAIVNNAANTFGARSVNFKKGRKCLNAYLVELACKAKINFVLATFEALPELESPPLNQCFERSQHLSGGIGFDGVTEWVSWSPKKPQYIFVYKKVNAGWKCHCDFVNAVVVNGEVNTSCAQCVVKLGHVTRQISSN